MSSYSFQKSYRLLSKSDFNGLRSGARRFQTHYIRCFYKTNTHGKSRLGISVSKKVGNAVVRNFFKRRVREYFRKSEIKNSDFDILVVVFPKISELDKDKRNEELLNFLQRFEQRVLESHG